MTPKLKKISGKKYRALIPKKDTIRATDVWDLSDNLVTRHAIATSCAGIGQKYQGATPCYRPLKTDKKKKPWGSFKLKGKTEVKRIIADGDYERGMIRIAEILKRDHLTNDHKIGMIDSVLFGLLITPITKGRK